MSNIIEPPPPIPSDGTPVDALPLGSGFLTYIFISVVAVALLVLYVSSTAEYNYRQRLMTQYMDVVNNNYIFCKECCWENEFQNKKIYTCADSKEQLWDRIP